MPSRTVPSSRATERTSPDGPPSEVASESDRHTGIPPKRWNLRRPSVTLRCSPADGEPPPRGVRLSIVRPLPLLLLLAVSACGAPAGDDALEPASGCASATPPSNGPVLLQQPPEDVSGPLYAARTDGPCELLLTFTGAPDGDGPCNVAEYVGRLEPDGENLQLVVDERHTGQQPGPGTICPDIGAARQMRVTLDELGGDAHGPDVRRTLTCGAAPSARLCRRTADGGAVPRLSPLRASRRRPARRAPRRTARARREPLGCAAPGRAPGPAG